MTLFRNSNEMFLKMTINCTFILIILIITSKLYCFKLCMQTYYIQIHVAKCKYVKNIKD